MKYPLILAVSLLSAMAVTAFADDKPLTQADVEETVKKVIAQHPELIVKSVQDYQSKEHEEANAKTEEKIALMQNEIKQDKLSPSVGNSKASVTIVEFFDYHCGYCKRFFPSLTQLVNEDKDVRVVFKEFPILTEDSELAAKAALAVNSIDPDKYFAFHTALMKVNGRFDMDVLTDTAKSAGINVTDFKRAMESPDVSKEIERTKSLAASLNISGTPALIIGTQLVPGAIDLDTLKTKVAEARAEKGKKS